MITLHPEFLENDGKPEFVVLPYDEYKLIEGLLEEKDDLQLYLQAKAEHNDGPTRSLREIEDEIASGN